MVVLQGLVIAHKDSFAGVVLDFGGGEFEENESSPHSKVDKRWFSMEPEFKWCSRVDFGWANVFEDGSCLDWESPIASWKIGILHHRAGFCHEDPVAYFWDGVLVWTGSWSCGVSDAITCAEGFPFFVDKFRAEVRVNPQQREGMKLCCIMIILLQGGYGFVLMLQQANADVSRLVICKRDVISSVSTTAGALYYLEKDPLRGSRGLQLW